MADDVSVAGVLAIAQRDGDLSAEHLGSTYQAQLATNRAKRQQAAAFYTPRDVVDFVVARSLGPALVGKTVEQILALRVLDPACGAGVFLAAALDTICAVLAELGEMPGKALQQRVARSCLRGVDIDPVAVELAAIALGEKIGASVPLKECFRCADSLLTDLEPCDVLLTNPPWGQKNLRYEPPMRARLRARYTTAKGPLDPFKLFIELAHRVLAPGGRWAMVLPDIVLLKNHEPTRRLMLEESSLEHIVHIGRAFKEVNLDACIITGVRGAPSTDHRVAIASSLQSAQSAQSAQSGRVRAQAQFAALAGAKLNIIATDDDLERVASMRQLARLADRFEIHEGVHSGNRRHALFVDGPTMPSAPLVFGRNEISPYRLRWRGRFVDLDPSAVGRDGGGYANLGHPRWHLRKKIVVRRTGDRMVVAFDSIGRYVSNNFFVVVPRTPMSDEHLRAACALLGSSTMTWYFRTVQPRVGRLFAELKIVQLADFPLPSLTRREVEELSALVKKLEQASSDDEHSSITRALDHIAHAAYDRIGR